MRVKIFITGPDKKNNDIESDINEWLEYNEYQIEVNHTQQTMSESGHRLVIAIWYERRGKG